MIKGHVEIQLNRSILLIVIDAVAKKMNKKNGYQSDDDNIRYKLNTQYFNNNLKSPNKHKKEKQKIIDDDEVRYKFPTVLNRTKPAENKPKPKQKIKVNFWSNKQTSNRLHNVDPKSKTNRRHTVGAPNLDKSDKVVKVRKRVSFLPSPIFSENHIPMVTVPDDLTIQLNEEEANDLGEDLNQAFVNNGTKVSKRKSLNSENQMSTKHKKKQDSEPRIQGNETELEFFSKYVVQKLRKMETNQRIYSENLINTVLMLGQLGKLNGKSKIAEV